MVLDLQAAPGPAGAREADVRRLAGPEQLDDVVFGPAGVYDVPLTGSTRS